MLRRRAAAVALRPRAAARPPTVHPRRADGRHGRRVAARRIVLIAGGRIVADGSTAQIRSRASGRTVTAILPEAGQSAAMARLREIDGVVDVATRIGRVSVVAADSDAVARVLLTEMGGTDLEITCASLEQAFLALTGDEAAGEGDSDGGSPPSGIQALDGSDHDTKELTR